MSTRTVKTNPEQLYLAAVKQSGDLDLARSYSGLSKEEAAKIPANKIIQARAEFDQARLTDAVKLRSRARDFALLLEDPKAMLLVADHLAPELGVAGQERARAKAKSQYQQPQQVNVNIGMAELADRLQKALKNNTP